MARIGTVRVPVVFEFTGHNWEMVAEHWPEPLTDWSDATWLECSCGWSGLEHGTIDWWEHIQRAAGNEVRDPAVDYRVYGGDDQSEIKGY